MKRIVAITAAVAFACAACRLPSRSVQFRPIAGGTLTTPGVVITAEDGSFRIVAGERFESPFQQGGDCLLDPSSENYAQGLATGARPVAIDLADGSRVYGLLSLCGAPENTGGTTAARSYQIEVPEGYVAATSGGRVSVVFEHFTSGTLGAKTWILWLAETSFAREAPVGGGRTTQVAVEEKLRGPHRVARAAGILGASGGGALVISLALLTSDPGTGGTIAGATVGICGVIGLILWPSLYAGARSQARQVEIEVGAVELTRPDTGFARRSGIVTPPTLGWSWVF